MWLQASRNGWPPPRRSPRQSGWPPPQSGLSLFAGCAVLPARPPLPATFSAAECSAIAWPFLPCQRPLSCTLSRTQAHTYSTPSPSPLLLLLLLHPLSGPCRSPGCVPAVRCLRTLSRAPLVGQMEVMIPPGTVMAIPTAPVSGLRCVARTWWCSTKCLALRRPCLHTVRCKSAAAPLLAFEPCALGELQGRGYARGEGVLQVLQGFQTCRCSVACCVHSCVHSCVSHTL